MLPENIADDIDGFTRAQRHSQISLPMILNAPTVVTAAFFHGFSHRFDTPPLAIASLSICTIVNYQQHIVCPSVVLLSVIVRHFHVQLSHNFIYYLLQLNLLSINPFDFTMDVVEPDCLCTVDLSSGDPAITLLSRTNGQCFISRLLDTVVYLPRPNLPIAPIVSCISVACSHPCVT
jgi:hypothetical protein